MAHKKATTIAGVLSALLAATPAGAQHPEGTPDPQPQPPEISRPRVDDARNPAPHEAQQEEPRRPPSTLPYYEWAAVPYGYSLRMSSARKVLVASGVTTLATMHLAAFILGIGVAASGCDGCGGHGGALMIPVAGPFIAFGQQGRDEPRGLYPVLGVFQVLGLGMIMTGMTLNDRRLVREDRFFPSRPGVSFTPTFGPGQGGLGARVSF